jgi:hypothetical protein
MKMCSLRLSRGLYVWLHDVGKKVPSPLVGEGQGEGEPAPNTLSPTPLPSRERGVLHVASQFPTAIPDASKALVMFGMKE